jgi:hypothetical protein
MQQHRADVNGGFRRRRDKIVEVRPAVHRPVMIERDPKWGMQRFTAGKQKDAKGSPIPPPRPRYLVKREEDAAAAAAAAAAALAEGAPAARPHRLPYASLAMASRALAREDAGGPGASVTVSRSTVPGTPNRPGAAGVGLLPYAGRGAASPSTPTGTAPALVYGGSMAAQLMGSSQPVTPARLGPAAAAGQLKMV